MRLSDAQKRSKIAKSVMAVTDGYLIVATVFCENVRKEEIKRRQRGEMHYIHFRVFQV